MSFTNAPVTRTLVVGLVSASAAASLFDLKHYFYILVDKHLWTYHQPWRALIFQFCYTNSAEVLLAAITLYNMRVVERMWGSRKYASFLIITTLLTSLTTTTLQALILRPITANTPFFNLIPAGPTPVLFAILAQYHAMVPHIYNLRLALTTASPADSDNNPNRGLVLSDKSFRYIFPLQLALSAWPGSLLGALVGWLVGLAWRGDLLPGAVTRWRLPGWMVGERATRRSQEFEGLRRRLEGESAPSAAASGVQGQGGAEAGDAGRRRTLGQQVLERVTGVI